MSGAGARDVVIRDVTLRDGLQLAGGILPTDRKVALVRELLALGVPALEVGSMARPDRVPPMADTLDVVARLSPEELEKCWLWVATPAHVARAIDAGVKNMQYCLSVTDSHNLANVGRTTQESMAGLPEALDRAATASASLQLCLAISFTCPFEGPVAPDRVLALVRDGQAMGVADVVICDTLGQASPDEVASMIARVRHEMPDVGVVFHGHDTWGMGVANALAAAAAGAWMVDGALGGLGGCPFAPGASGNTSTEDLAFALRPAWVDPESFGALLRLGRSVVEALAEPNRSRTSSGAGANTSPFPWAAHLP